MNEGSPAKSHPARLPGHNFGPQAVAGGRLFYRDAFFGTFAPFLRASESPIAIACFLLFTTPPLPPFPERKVPCFLRRIALLTVLLAARPYLAILFPPTMVKRQLYKGM